MPDGLEMSSKSFLLGLYDVFGLGDPDVDDSFGLDDTIRRSLDPENNIGHWSEFDRSGHFAAMEAPDLLTGDVRKFFRRFR